VLAFGPGANNFKGIYQNNEVFNRLLLDIKWIFYFGIILQVAFFYKFDIKLKYK
jgi:hypothetical protein